MSTSVATGSSIVSQTETAVKSALRTAQSALRDKPNVGILFASPKHDLKKALAPSAELMPGTQFVGCSTAGEISERGFTKGGVTATLIASSDLACSIKTAAGISKDHGKAAQTLCSDLDA